MNGHKFAVRRVIANGKVGGANAGNVDRLMHDQVLIDEWNRCFGNSHFDHIVDFSGYSPLWMRILLQGPAKTHATWLHNDLRSDADRTVNGRTPHHDNLYVNFALYKYIDRLVSVSPALAEVNRAKLGEYADPAKFTYAENAINYRRIRHLAFGITAHDSGPSKPRPGRRSRSGAEQRSPRREASRRCSRHCWSGSRSTRYRTRCVAGPRSRASCRRRSRAPTRS